MTKNHEINVFIRCIHYFTCISRSLDIVQKRREIKYLTCFKLLPVFENMIAIRCLSVLNGFKYVFFGGNIADIEADMADDAQMAKRQAITESDDERE
ncbi:MAG: hypothetical protein RR084_06050 [Bacteroidales bacterium]